MCKRNISYSNRQVLLKTFCIYIIKDGQIGQGISTGSQPCVQKFSPILTKLLAFVELLMLRILIKKKLFEKAFVFIYGYRLKILLTVKQQKSQKLKFFDIFHLRFSVVFFTKTRLKMKSKTIFEFLMKRRNRPHQIPLQFQYKSDFNYYHACSQSFH
jgi:hypothetical protein